MIQSMVLYQCQCWFLQLITNRTRARGILVPNPEKNDPNQSRIASPYQNQALQRSFVRVVILVEPNSPWTCRKRLRPPPDNSRYHSAFHLSAIMMQGSYGNDEGGMQPMETDTYDGENEGVFRDGYSRRGSCHPCNKFILIGGIIFVALALAAGISVNNNNATNSSNANNNNAPTPAPVLPPSYFDQGSPTYVAPVNPPALPPQPTAPQSFQLMGDFLYPPPRDSTLPDHVKPSTEFGHASELHKPKDCSISLSAMTNTNTRQHSTDSF